MNPTRTIETQCTHARFMQTLPDACGYRPYEITDNSIIVFVNADQRVNIAVHDESIRHLGSLDLPMESARFEFVGFEENEADSFMEHFRMHALRAGGG